MNEAAEAIARAMSENQSPADGWDMPGLRRMTGLSVGAFAAGVARLRAEGRMAAFALELVTQDAPAPEPTLAEQVAAEARASVDKRAAARSGTPGVLPALSGPTAGALLQQRALEGAPGHAAAILRDRWGPTWDRVCRHAHATNQRPVAAMIALLDRGLEREAHA